MPSSSRGGSDPNGRTNSLPSGRGPGADHATVLDRPRLRRAIELGQRHGFHPDGLEGEVSREIAHRSGKSSRGFWMPHEARLDTTTTGAGAAATVWPPRMFIDVLRAKLVIEALGGQITSLSADPGVVQLPVQTSGTAVTWVAEGSNAGANTGLAVSSVTFTPHTAICNSGISRFMKDTEADGFDDWLYADLAKQIAVAVDQVAINGAGAASYQPLGILQSPNTTSYTLAADSGSGGAPSYADLVGMEEVLGNANADTRADARLGLCTSPNGRSKLRRTDSSALVAGTSGQWCWPQLYNTVLGHPAQATTNVPNNLVKNSVTGLSALIFADWTNLIANLFSAVDLLINPYTITSLGYYSIYAYQEVDVQIALRGRLPRRRRHDHDLSLHARSPARDPRWIRNPSDELAIAQGCWFDESAGLFVIDFIQEFCRQSQGRWAGQPLILLEWQRDFLMRLFGWRAPDGLRRFRRAYLEIAKKNGKSTMISAVCLLLLLIDGEGSPQVFLNACDKEQASIVFDEAKHMVEKSPELLRRLDIVDSRKTIVHAAGDGKIVANSSEVNKQDGFNPSGIVFDELHRQPNYRLWEVFKYASVAREQPLTISMTTAGEAEEGVWFDQRVYSEKVNAGVIPDTTHLGVIYRALPTDDLDDPATWARPIRRWDSRSRQRTSRGS